MTDKLTNDRVELVQTEFAQRCHNLNLPIWQFDAAGQVLREPANTDKLAPSLQSPSLQVHIERLASTWTAEDEPQSVELSANCRLLPFVCRLGSQRLGMSIVMAMNHPIINGGGHGNQPLPSPISLDQLEQLLQSIHDDITTCAGDRQTLFKFSDQLASAYEEITLMHTLGRAMNRITNARDFVTMMCQQVLENQPFAWIAIGFSDRDEVVAELAGHVELAGTPPCHRSLIKHGARQLVARINPDKWNVLLDSQRSDLPTLINTEVLAHPITHDGKAIGVLIAGNKDGDDSKIGSVEMQFLDTAADFLGIFHENTARHVEQHTLFTGTIQAMTAAIDAKDRYTCGHSERVALIARLMAVKAELGGQVAEQYHVAGLVHDVGKIGVPEAVLQKSGRLTDNEFEQIKQHPVIGYEILKDIVRLTDMLPGVLYHHERWDGKGYPHGLSGADIPLIGRVLAVADTFDAMSSTRSYRPSIARGKVLEEIRQCAGTQFDPELAEIFLQIDLQAYDHMVSRHHAANAYAA